MGTIFRALDLQTGEKVALKVLHGRESRSTQRFNQEAALLAELRHPSIVRYVDHGVTPAGEHYLAMEWLEGETLEDRLLKGPLGVVDTARLGRRVLEGLEVAHRRGIVHRDIKPANLFLPGGALFEVKILDFGIARRMFDTRRITITGSTLGTPMYMSPEQARGVAALDARSDLFSVGCVLFECVTGQPPFTGENPVAVLAKICLDPLDVRGRCRGVPAPFVAILERMLAKDRDQRPRSAAELAAELGRLVEVLKPLAADDRSRPVALRTPTPVMTSGEQSVLSAILVSRPRPLTPVDAAVEHTGTWDLVIPDVRIGPIDIFDERGFAEVQRVLEPFGARVDRFLGGSMVITLVGSGSLADQAARAARCALNLKALLPRAAFAVSTGRGEPGRALPMGQVIDWAARLLAGERPGAISLDGDTAALLEPRFEIWGRDKKYLLFEKGGKGPPRTVLGMEMPCIGRDRELAALETIYEESTGEPGARVVLVTAAAGGGKSRLRHEFVERIQARGRAFEYLLGLGDALRAGAPFGLLGTAVRAAAGIVGGEPAPVQQKRLFAHVSRHLPPDEAGRVVAFVGEMAGVPFPDEDLPALRAARREPRLMADQVLAAWLDWLQAESAVRPVLLVLEDLHLGDAASVQLVDAALRALAERPFMVVALARPEVDQAFPGLWAERDPQRLELPPLTSKACQKLARFALGELPAEKGAWLVERTGGNPFHLEELLRAVACGLDPAKQDAPRTAIELVKARFDALGRPARRVLRAASVFGERFRAAGVRALLGDDAIDVEATLDLLELREVIYPRPTADAREYVFRHALVRDAAYELLSGDDRAFGHRLAGELLEQAGEREAAVLVEHFDRGGALDRAAQGSRVAAARALAANDPSGVLAWVERGVRFGATGEVLGDLRLAEAQARAALGQHAEAERAAREAFLLCDGAPRLRALGELVAALGAQHRFDDIEGLAAEARAHLAVGDERPAWVACLVRAAEHLLGGGRHAAAEQTIATVEAQGGAPDPVLAARLQEAGAHLALQRGEVARAVAGFEAASAGFVAAGDLRGHVLSLTGSGAALCALGMLEQAEERLEAARGLAERLDVRPAASGALASLVLARGLLGRIDEARAAAESAIAIARGQGDRRREAEALLHLAQVDQRAGDLGAAEAHAYAAAEASRELPPLYPAALAALARALLAQGRDEEAFGHARRAHALLESGGDGPGQVLVRLVLAECALAAGDPGAGQEALRRACELLEERAAGIDRPDERAAFLNRLPDHVRVRDLARAVGLR